MIDRGRTLPLIAPTQQLGISRGSIYHLPQPVADAGLEMMRRIDGLHLLYPFAGSRMLRDLLPQGGHGGRPAACRDVDEPMRIEAIYRRPNTSKLAPGNKRYRCYCASWQSSDQLGLVNGHHLSAHAVGLRLVASTLREQSRDAFSQSFR